MCRLRWQQPAHAAGRHFVDALLPASSCLGQIYVVVVDEATGQLVQQGLDELAILVSQQGRQRLACRQGAAVLRVTAHALPMCVFAAAAALPAALEASAALSPLLCRPRGW